MQSRKSKNANCFERQLLPQFDDNIERVLGIILLYQLVLNSSSNQVQQAQCSDVYSVDLLAHYFAHACLKLGHHDGECHSQNEFCIKYGERFRDNGNSFISDILRCYLYQVFHKQMTKNNVYSHKCAAILAERKPLGQFNTKRLPILMILSSVEYLNSFR